MSRGGRSGGGVSINSATEEAREVVEQVGSGTIQLVADIGGIAEMAVRTFAWLLRPPIRVALLFEQLDYVGVGSIFVVGITGLFTGMVFAVETYHAFALFNAQGLVGSTVALSLARELGPVFAGLMVTARVGSSIATELGSMRVSEQIDALETMAVSPLQYLVLPRVLACVLMMPVLTILFDGVGIVGAYLVSVIGQGVSAASFLGRIHNWVDPQDIIGGLIKAAVFGLLIALIACYKGFNARGGAKGVGLATNEAVVMASVTVLISDYFLSILLTPFWTLHSKGVQ